MTKKKDKRKHENGAYHTRLHGQNSTYWLTYEVPNVPGTELK